tara:strand:- start:1450 stop:1707 length:258 start_codon:yes stop_codon:yes gene_type:complete
MSDSEDENIVEEYIEFLINYKEMLEQSITSMTYKIQDHKEELKKIKKFLKKNCQHDIEIDHIDSMKNGDTMNQIIKYCKKCELTF